MNTYLFMITQKKKKTLVASGSENFFNLLKSIYKQPTTNILLIGKDRNPECFSCKIGKMARISALTALIQHNPGYSSHSNKAIKT